MLDAKLLAALNTWVFNSTRQTLSLLDVNNNFFFQILSMTSSNI